MSKYAHEPLSFQGLKTVPIQARGGKVRVEQFGKPYMGAGVSAWLDSLPHILAADSLRSVVNALAKARERKKMILWGLGGHVIKCGLAPVLIDLMHRGFANAVDVIMARVPASAIGNSSALSISLSTRLPTPTLGLLPNHSNR